MAPPESRWGAGAVLQLAASVALEKLLGRYPVSSSPSEVRSRTCTAEICSGPIHDNNISRAFVLVSGGALLGSPFQIQPYPVPE
jgi:hypothetical protein